MTKAELISIIENMYITPYSDEIEIYNKAWEKGLEIESGVEKYCMISDKIKYVVKWSQTKCKDGAMREVEVYRKAKAAGMEMFFPYTDFLFQSKTGINFILQEKIDYVAFDFPEQKAREYLSVNEIIDNALYKEFNSKMQVCDRDYCSSIDKIWLKKALLLYGTAICNKLCDFIRENKINDLHRGNVGYKNDKPVIIDFSGWWGD